MSNTPITRATRRAAAAATLVALLAAGCGDPDGTTAAEPTTAEPTAAATSEAAAAPNDTPTKDAVEPSFDAETPSPERPETEPSATEPSATEDAPTESESIESEPAAAAPAAVQPAGDVVDFASMNAAVLAAIGRTDVSTALAELGTFPADLAYPDGSILAEVSLEETDLRVLTGDPEAIRPISNRVGGLAITLVKIEEAEPQMDAALTSIGFELSSSGSSATTEGDGTEVRSAFYSRGGDGAVRESLLLTLVARPDTDYLEVDIDLTTDQDGEGLSAPITRWITGYPAPAGYTLQSARVSTFYIGSPSLSYSAAFSGPAGQIEPAMQEVQAALPAGGFEPGADTTIAGDPDLRILDLVAAGVGEGETTVSESGEQTSVRPLIDVEFPLPPALEPWLIG